MVRIWLGLGYFSVTRGKTRAISYGGGSRDSLCAVSVGLRQSTTVAGGAAARLTTQTTSSVAVSGAARRALNLQRGALTARVGGHAGDAQGVDGLYPCDSGRLRRRYSCVQETAAAGGEPW
jgi:hypothetical protein